MLGHVVRKTDEDWVKKAWSTWEVEGRRPRGRPKKSWEATITEDCNLLGHVGLRRVDALDRQNWKDLTANILPRAREKGQKR